MRTLNTTVNIICAGLLLLSAMTRSDASERSEARRVADSLDTAYESLEADLSRLDSTARLDDYLIVGASRPGEVRVCWIPS